MSSYEVRCPKCGGLMEMREVRGSRNRILDVPSFDWRCPGCGFWWKDLESKPKEAESL